MRFIHFTDTHLGKSEAKLEQREEDFCNVFAEVIDKCLSEKVDFVVHSGDVFDRARPSTKTIIFLVKQLNRLKGANIPFYTVPGSHDIAPDGTLLSVLDAVGLLVNLASSRYIRMENNKIILSGENFKDVFLCGVAGRRDNIADAYSNLKVEGDGNYKIFVFHHITSDIADKFADIPSSLLPQGFDYYAAGHWHGFAKLQHGKGILVYPGSTEYNELDEMIRDKHKYAILVEFKDGKTTIKELPLKTREIVFCEINCDSMDAREVSDKTVAKIPKDKDGAILIIKFRGRLGKGTKSEIDRNKINEFAIKNGYLYTKIYLGELENPETPHVSTKARSASDIEKEYLKKQGYSEKEMSIAERMIALFGKKLGASEFASAKDNAIKSIEGAIIENKENDS